jgi:hypothetical protein
MGMFNKSNPSNFNPVLLMHTSKFRGKTESMKRPILKWSYCKGLAAVKSAKQKKHLNGYQAI